jgi:hypothetical protein
MQRDLNLHESTIIYYKIAHDIARGLGYTTKQFNTFLLSIGLTAGTVTYQSLKRIKNLLPVYKRNEENKTKLRAITPYATPAASSGKRPADSSFTTPAKKKPKLPDISPGSKQPIEVETDTQGNIRPGRPGDENPFTVGYGNSTSYDQGDQPAKTRLVLNLL